MHPGNPLKRPLPLSPAGRPMLGMPPLKRPRMPSGQFVGGVGAPQPYNTAGKERAVLRIRDPNFAFIPDPNFSHPGSASEN
jgi:hypothetical protein